MPEGYVEEDAEPEEQTKLERAETLFSSGDVQGARSALEEHLTDEPADARARYLLARTMGLQGELRGAKAEIRRSVKKQAKLECSVLSCVN